MVGIVQRPMFWTHASVVSVGNTRAEPVEPFVTHMSEQAQKLADQATAVCQ